MKWLFYILLLGAALGVRGQKFDTLAYGLNYVEYRGETVNVINRHGEPEGKWIEFDTSISTSSTKSISCSFGEVRSSTTTEQRDTTYLYAIRSWGNYKGGLKDGLWQKYSAIDSGRVDRHIMYSLGVIDYIKIFDKNGNVEIYAVPKPNSDKVDCIIYNADGSVKRKQEWDLQFLLTAF